ncbi:MAG TPA: rhamnulokinase [Lachnospiraceae bacterium]|nr:rhamnulokinase [Lachnospiraceae bacterium]
MTRHFAIDLGAESGRCMVGTLENSRLQMDELHRFPTQICTIRGEYYWNIYRYFDEIVTALKIYVSRYGPHLDSIGADSWGVDYCLLGHNHAIQGLPKSYRRMVSQKPYEVMEERFGKDRLYRHCGIQFLDFNTLNQFIQEMALDPDYLSDAHGMMFIADAIHFLLGAKPTCEYTAASISQLVNTRTKQWDDEILAAFSIPERLKTPIVFAGDVIGTLSEELAAAVGLKSGVKIIAPAAHDTASASVAVPALTQGNWASISSGTWSLASVEIDAPITDDACYRMNISNSAGVLGKSLFLKNIMGLWIIQQCKYQWETMHPGLGYAEIVELAEKAEPFKAFIDPDESCFFPPGDMPGRISDYLRKSGQTEIAPDDMGSVARVIYESLALKYRFILRRIADTCGTGLEALHITGGGTNNRMLNQFSANAFRIPVICGPKECSAMGNALMQAYGCGRLGSLREIRQVVCDSVKLDHYMPENTDLWEDAYRRFEAFLNTRSRH